MGRAVSQQVSATWVALALLLGAALISPAPTAELLVVTVALLALAVASSATIGSILGPQGPGLASRVGVRADHPEPLGRVTDPSHHPIAPRAPGPA